MRLSFKRLKIVEQILIVLIFAVVVPMFTIGIIINNINQQAVRKELRHSAEITSEIIASRIQNSLLSVDSILDEMVIALNNMPTRDFQNNYLKKISEKSSVFISIKLIDDGKNVSFGDKKIVYNKNNKSIQIYRKLNNSNAYLDVVFNLSGFEKNIFTNFEKDERQIYILDHDKNIIMAHNANIEEFEKTYNLLPKRLKDNESVVFGDVKNQPLVYYQFEDPKLTVIVNTTKNVTRKTITKASIRIFASVIAASFAIFLLVGIYTYYLYINMRQLFKGITALSKGNYKRKIRLLSNVLTPREIVFVAVEFNKMVDKINHSYKELKVKNIELKRLDAFRSNLIDTVSHEFRTPLTSIQGYTSRLLRQDIKIDEEMKIKSIKIIKRQSERLSRMVEDLLVIPDIEGSRLNIHTETVNLKDLFEIAIMSLKKEDKMNEIIITCEDNLYVKADKDRLEQVIINILENALKYSDENEPINILAIPAGNKISIITENKADFIPKEILVRLFEKFTRVDDKTTRETRGTGLGLYIVKGLVHAMKGEVKISSSKERIFKIKITLPRV